MTAVIDWKLLLFIVVSNVLFVALWIASIVYLLASLSGPNLQ